MTITDEAWKRAKTNYAEKKGKIKNSNCFDHCLSLPSCCCHWCGGPANYAVSWECQAESLAEQVLRQVGVRDGQVVGRANWEG